MLGDPPTARAEDWTYWRGPRYDGTSLETGLVDDWDPAGGEDSHLLWVRDDLGGISTPVAYDGRVYTLTRAEPGTRREGEKVVCLDAATGKTLWENRFNVYLSDVPDTRVGWSSCVVDPATGHVYALGVCGFFQCLDGKTGERLWSLPLHEQFGLLTTYGGRTNFPVVFEDLVIISGVIIGWGEMARPAHRFLGLDKLTGEVVWFESTRPLPEDTTYSGPSLAVLGGQQALVAGGGDGAIWALQPRTGQAIWYYRFSRRGLNVAPVVVGDRVYSGHSEENLSGVTMGAVAAVDGSGRGDLTEAGELWRVEELMVGKSSPLAIGNRLYVIDDRAKLFVLDADTGETVGRRLALGKVMRASPLYADGKIYAFTLGDAAGCPWFILRPDEAGRVEVVSKGSLPRGEMVYASPICADGRIFVQSSERLYCLYDAAKPRGAVAAPAQPAERPVSDDPRVVQVQVVPCEVLLQPGQQQVFRVRLFNERGQRLPDAEATFKLAGPGQLDATGNYTAPAELLHRVARITATVAGQSKTARIRIIPPLPWHFDFEDLPLSGPAQTGEPPETWVGCRYRHVIRELDGNKVMVKVSTIPKGTRSQGWFGSPQLHDYTIQADVRGAVAEGKMPDIGLTAQGYTIDLQGKHQALQIRSWVPQLRMASTVDFAWQPDRWYTMKLRAENQPGKAILRGKVWPRGEPEPEEWSVTAEDESPNVVGSPGLFGNASDAEIYLDNISVTPNTP